MVNIRDINGNIIVNVIISKDSVRRYSLGGDDNVVMKFSTDEPFVFDIGTYIDFSELKYDYPLIWKIGRFELTSKYVPKYNGMTGGYDYEVRFDAHYLKWKNKILKYNPNRNKQYGNSEAAWVLTATPSVFGAIVAQNLKELGYKWYNPETKGWVNYIFTCVEGCDDAKSITLTFANTPILDAISMIAEACNGGEGCDWWIDKNTIYIGRCENGEVIDLSYQTNIATLDIQDGENDYATRIYAFGGTRNIPKGYGKDFNEDVVRAAIVQRNLMLPYYAKGQVPQQIISELKEKYPSIPEYTGQRFVDAESNLSQEQLVEQVVVFEDIYPSQEGEVSELKLETEAEKDTDGNETGETLYHYEFKDVSLKNFKDDYLTEEPLSITFSSGLLNGFTFELEKLSSDGTGTVFYIKVSEDYGQMLPNDVLKPKNGDKFNIFNYDISLVEDDLVGKAEVELLKKAYEYINKSSEDQKTYTITAFSDWSYNNGNVRIFDLGQKVKIDIPSLFGEKGKTSRIISIEYKLDAPYDSPILTVGETKAFSRLKALEGEVGDLAHKGKYYALSGQGGVYVIKSTDPHTPSSEYNVYSSLKSEKHFLFKTKEDSAKERITFEKGVTVNKEAKISGYIYLNERLIKAKDTASELVNSSFSPNDDHIPSTKAVTEHVTKYTDEHYIHCDEEDTAKEKIIFEKGIEVSNFTPGVTDGTGGAMEVRDGNVHLTTDYLNVRRKARFNEVEIQTTHHIGGAQISSAASCKIDFVQTALDANGNPSAYRCYFRKTDKDGNIIGNPWKIGDQAYCNTFNLEQSADGQTGNHFLWMLVLYVADKGADNIIADDGQTYNGTDYAYINLSATRCAEGSDAPLGGDEIVLLGHQKQSSESSGEYEYRQTAIYQSSANPDGGKPYYRQYVGINSFSLDGCLEQQFMPGNNIFRGKVVVTGGDWSEFLNEGGNSLQDNIDGLGADITNLIGEIEEVYGDIETIRNQIDGVVESFFFAYTPTKENEPAATWISEGTEAEHEGDTFTNTSTEGDGAGKSWRWIKQNDGTYNWQVIADADAQKALLAAAKAQDTADGKRRVFVETPYVPYDIGDLWVQGESGDIMRCQKAKKYGIYKADDWVKASKYTDDSALEDFQTKVYNPMQELLQGQIDGKIETYSQTEDPQKSWVINSYYDVYKHVGDIWYNPVEQRSYRFQVATADEFEWVEIKDKDAVAAMAAAGSIQNFLDTEYKKDLANIQGQLDEKAQTWYQGSHPSNEWDTTEKKKAHVGDLWYCTVEINDKYKKDTTWRWGWKDGSTTEYEWKQQNVPKAVFDYIDGKASIFVEQPKPPYNIGDIWVNAEYSGTLEDGTAVTYDGDLLRCFTSRSADDKFAIDDWGLASLYITENRAQDIVNNAVNNIDTSKFDYLGEAIKGTTELLNGLILTNTMGVGRFKEDEDFESEEFKENITAGINGITTNNADDIALWGGGTLSKAQRLAAFYKDNPKAQPTDEELAEMAKFVVTHGGKAILQNAIVSGTIHATNGSFINGTFKNVVINGAYNRLVQTVDDSNYKNFLYNDGDDNEYYALLLQWGDVIHLNLTTEDLRTAPQIMLPTSIPYYDDIAKEVKYSNALGYRTNDAGDIVPMDIDDLRSLVGRKIVIHADDVRTYLLLNVGNIYMETSIPDDGQEFYLTSPEQGNWVQSVTDGQIYIGKGETFIMECLLAKRKFLIDPNTEEQGWTIAEMICWSVQKITMSSKQQAGDIIAFKVNCDGYPSTWRAEKGMTWEDFVDSSYSNEQFSIDSNDNVCFNDGDAWDLYHNYDEENETFTNNVNAREAINEGDNYYAG